MKASILIVEDEPQLRALLRLYLEREGYRVTDAGDGPLLWPPTTPDRGDLVILDLMLPGMQGETVLEELRDRGAVPVLITSRQADRCRADRRPAAGADDYLGKPFNPHELTARVAAILRRRGAGMGYLPMNRCVAGQRTPGTGPRHPPLHAGRCRRAAD